MNVLKIELVPSTFGIGQNLFVSNSRSFTKNINENLSDEPFQEPSAIRAKAIKTSICEYVIDIYGVRCRPVLRCMFTNPSKDLQKVLSAEYLSPTRFISTYMDFAKSGIGGIDRCAE